MLLHNKLECFFALAFTLIFAVKATAYLKWNHRWQRKKSFMKLQGSLTDGEGSVLLTSLY
jgi:hypothetical protein